MAVRVWVCNFPTSSNPVSIRYSTVSWEDPINEAHSISFETARGDPQVTADLLPCDGTREVHVEVDGTIVASGILWEASAGSDSIRFDAGGFLDYYKGRRIRLEATYTDYEQFDLVRWLIQHAHAQSFPPYVTDPNIQMDDVRTDPFVLRTMEFKIDSRSEVLSTIETLSEMDNGFDFQIDAAWQSNRIVKQWSFWHPLRGESRGIVLRHGKNCVVDDWRIDGRKPNVITVFGKTPDRPEQVEGQPEPPDPTPFLADAYTFTQTSSRPAIEDTISDNDLPSNDACFQRALGEADKNTAQDIPTVTLFPDGPVRFEDIGVGDVVGLVVDDFYGFKGDCRIVSRRGEVDGSGQLGTTLELAATTGRARAREKLAAQIGGIRRRLDRLETR